MTRADVRWPVSYEERLRFGSSASARAISSEVLMEWHFSCMSHQARRRKCGARYMPVEAVERAIEQRYRRVQLTPTEVASIRAQIQDQVEAKLALAQKQSDHPADGYGPFKTSSRS